MTSNIYDINKLFVDEEAKRLAIKHLRQRFKCSHNSIYAALKPASDEYNQLHPPPPPPPSSNGPRTLPDPSPSHIPQEQKGAYISTP